MFSILCLFLACQAEESRRERAFGTDDPSSSTDSESSSVSEGLGGCDEMDLLFIIDNSSSMESVKENLFSNFPKFVGVLNDYNASKGGGLKFRLGVTTSSVTRDFVTTLPNSDFEQPFSTSGDDGALLGQSECELSAPWTDGPSPTFQEDFSCLAQLHTNETTTVEMPLLAMELALGEQSAPGRPNAGFFEPKSEALLVAVIITNEDDCSIEEGGRLMFTGTGSCDDEGSEGLHSPASVKAYLDDLTGGEGRYVVLVIAGPGPGKCESIFGQAWEALRLRRLVEELGDSAMFGSLCQDDLWMTLEATLSAITATCDDLPLVM
jgi:hypothetical protein